MGRRSVVSKGAQCQRQLGVLLSPGGGGGQNSSHSCKKDLEGALRSLLKASCPRAVVEQ